MQISVIIPIYGVEKYIEQCLRALFTQTKTDGVEFILVNDCTKDKSMEVAAMVIAEYPNLEVKIINHEVNGGPAVARQTGMDAATGDYVLQVDSDDWIEPTMLEEMYAEAIATNADVVVCDWVKLYPNKKLRTNNVVANSGIECAKLQLQGKLTGSLCLMLIKRSVITTNNIRQIAGLNINEDIIFSFKVFCSSNKVSSISSPFYNYRMNAASLSHKPNQKTIHDLRRALQEIERFIVDNKLEELNQYLMFKKISQKHNLLVLTQGTQQRELAQVFPEANSYIAAHPSLHPLNKLALQQAVKGRLWVYNLILKSKNCFRSITRG